jgi:hypothetical protein
MVDIDGEVGPARCSAPAQPRPGLDPAPTAYRDVVGFDEPGGPGCVIAHRCLLALS